MFFIINKNTKQLHIFKWNRQY